MVESLSRNTAIKELMEGQIVAFIIIDHNLTPHGESFQNHSQSLLLFIIIDHNLAQYVEFCQNLARISAIFMLLINQNPKLTEWVGRENCWGGEIPSTLQFEVWSNRGLSR